MAFAPSSDLPRGPVEVHPPRGEPLPLVLDSPHSGEHYPADFDHAVPRTLLRQAEDVVVLTIDAQKSPLHFSDPPGSGLAAYLVRHGAQARVKQVTSSGGTADTILAQVAEEQADLLVMGGYGHSRMREMLFGGVTRSIMENSATPVLLSH